MSAWNELLNETKTLGSVHDILRRKHSALGSKRTKAIHLNLEWLYARLSQLRAQFVTCYPADARTQNKLIQAPFWTLEDCFNALQ